MVVVGPSLGWTSSVPIYCQSMQMGVQFFKMSPFVFHLGKKVISLN